MSFDLKKKHSELKRNVKFDEEDGGLFMDVRLREDAEWKRVKPAQARAAMGKRRGGRLQDLGEDELKGLLGSEDE